MHGHINVKCYVVLRRFDWHTATDVSKNCGIPISKLVGLLDRVDGCTSDYLPKRT